VSARVLLVRKLHSFCFVFVGCAPFSQGIDSTRPRAISGFIPMTEVVALMRALGYYPTEQQIKEMMNEIQHYRDTTTPAPPATKGGQPLKQQVNLEEFIKCKLVWRARTRSVSAASNLTLCLLACVCSVCELPACVWAGQRAVRSGVQFADR
jgi:hypothetical protein